MDRLVYSGRSGWLGELRYKKSFKRSFLHSLWEQIRGFHWFLRQKPSCLYCNMAHMSGSGYFGALLCYGLLAELIMAELHLLLEPERGNIKFLQNVNFNIYETVAV